ncbi:MAG: HNH endonuclease, partial [Bdellovibrionales bacterium]|nr:HNH endonuclease [Bdellovibrionales bacterium]
KLRGERSEYLTADVIDMKTPVSEEVYKMLVQVQDLLSTAKGKAVTMEEVFKSLAAEYLEKHDPVRKAERITKKKELIKIEKTKAKNSGLKNYIKQFATKEELTKNIKQHATKVEIKNNKKLTSTKIEITKNIKQPATKIELNKNIDSAPIKSQPATNSLGQRTAIPAEIAHKVHLRDQGQCRHHYPSGERCNTKRWLHLHHKQPVSQGGEHSVDNLISLCPAHHELAHLILENKITKEPVCPGKILITKNI